MTSCGHGPIFFRPSRTRMSPVSACQSEQTIFATATMALLGCSLGGRILPDVGPTGLRQSENKEIQRCDMGGRALGRWWRPYWC